MTQFDAFDQQLGSWLGAAADIPAPAGLQERVLGPTTRVQPRPAVVASVGSHWVSDMPAGPLAALPWARAGLAVIVVLLVLGAAMLVGSRLREEPPGGMPLLYNRHGDIVMAEWDGTGPVVIADSAAPDDGTGTSYSLGPNVWAPDGSHFAYQELSGQGTKVTTHVSDASGRHMASFEINKSERGGTSTWWSPDSTLLATFPWSAGPINIFDVEGRLRQVLPLPDGYAMFRESGLSWAPDGRSVLAVITAGGGVLEEREVWQMPIDGTEPRRLPVDNPLASWDLRLTRDGRLIAFSGHNGPFPDGPIFVANGDGTDATPVTHNDVVAGHASFPMWSPDETQLAYMVAVTRGGLRYQLRVVDLRTGVDRLVLRAKDDGSVNRGWSAAGDRLLLRAFEVDPVVDGVAAPRRQADGTALWSVGLDGTDVRLLVEDVASFGAAP